MTIRKTQADDIPALQAVLDATELFPSEMLPEMIAPFLQGLGTPEVWLTSHGQEGAQGFCYAVPEQLAEGTWNMLAIAVAPDQQGQGHGKALVAALEALLRKQGARILIADTSGIKAFANTRAFYEHADYTAEARIRDFWGPGDDKVIYWKALGDAE